MQRPKFLKQRFIDTMVEVHKIINIPIGDITRDDYIRITVDCGIVQRLNKEELMVIGGFKSAKKLFFPNMRAQAHIPKVLIFDIETSPIEAYVWGLWKNDVGLNQIKADWFVLSWSAKWLGEDEVMYMDNRKATDVSNDRKLLRGIWKLLDEADVVITQNGINFDIKKLNARFIIQGFQPPSSVRHIDTCKIAKKYFAFTSNKLAYMTDKINTKYKKLDHGKFPGFMLWSECLKGNQEAWEEMELYNKHDVLSLEELYNKLIAWENAAPDFNIFHDEEINVCKCGSTNFMKNGYYYTPAGKYQKVRCKKCGAEQRSSDNLLSTAKRKSLKKKAVR